MILAASDNGTLRCRLCRWEAPFADWEEAERAVREHLGGYHQRLLVSYLETSRKGKTERTWSGPRLPNAL